MPFGVMGGHYQAMGHMHLLTRLLDDGLDIQQAIDAPRLMVDPDDGAVECESTVPRNVQDALRARGHRLKRPDRPIGGAQAIWIDWDEDMLTGGSEPRKDGAAIGY